MNHSTVLCVEEDVCVCVCMCVCVTAYRDKPGPQSDPGLHGCCDKHGPQSDPGVSAYSTGLSAIRAFLATAISMGPRLTWVLG